MPTVVELFSRSTQAKADYLELDKEICQLLEIPPHDDSWGGGVCDWYNGLIFGLALGHDFTSIRKVYENNPTMLRVAEYLDERFTTHTYREF